ncbi:MAG TPA: CHAD domain-containing protein [Pyrinomonadaceae bacterium]|nr:CHAD domain-containing protein [Pyrinomonadaceae bacterium]
MAKAKEITGIDCAADALEWAEKVLRLRFDEITELRGAALDFSDIEGVHAMRVATRRLRSALRDFLPLVKKRPLRRVRKNLKEIADALGAVRDQDVAILALEHLQSAAEIDQIDLPVKEGIGKILEERRAERETAQINLVKTLDPDGLAKVREDFTAALDKAVKNKKRARVVSFNEAGRDAVAASLDDLCELGASLYEPFKVEKLHEMRIAAKRLRYAVELFTACWGDSIAPFAGEIAQMQSFLGEVHDCDVWIENLGGRLNDDGNGAANRNERPVAVWLLSKFVKNRTKNYRDALQLWNEWETNDFTKRMQAIIQTV